jgi:heat shock protein HslJ
MTGRQTLTLIALLLVALMLIGWGARSAQRVAGSDPAGTYISFPPDDVMGGQVVILQVHDDAGKSAIMTIDAENRSSLVMRRGTWHVDERGQLATIFDDHSQYAFAAGPDMLVLRDPVADEWGPGSLNLGWALLQLDTVWRWEKTAYADGTVVAPATSTPFLLKLGSDLRLSITGDCNTAGGDFRIRRGGLLSVADVIGTQRFCEGSREETFMRDLGSVVGYTVRGDTLVLQLSDGRSAMTFTRYDGAIPAQ